MIDLKTILRRGEDSRTQFKSTFKSVDALAAEICAMANSHGGQIIVGVSDSGEIEGVQDLQRLNGMISNACSQKIDPPLSVTTRNVVESDRCVVLIEVPLGPNKPYVANKRDYWVKVGADKRRATREELKRLMQASGGLFADEMVLPPTGIEDVDRYAFSEFFRANLCDAHRYERHIIRKRLVPSEIDGRGKLEFGRVAAVRETTRASRAPISGQGGCLCRHGYGRIGIPGQ